MAAKAEAVKRAAAKRAAKKRAAAKAKVEKPQKVYVYRNKKGWIAFLAVKSRRVSLVFKTEATAMRHAKAYGCPVYKGSEYKRLTPDEKTRVQQQARLLKKEEGYSKERAFAAANSMANRGTLPKLRRET